jgi:hypothetical protein
MTRLKQDQNLKVQSSRPLSAKECKALRAALVVNENFFGYSLPRVNIVVCHSKGEWRRATTYYHFEFARGVVMRDGTVVVKSPLLARRSVQQWQKIVAHEINHAFWMRRSARGRDLWSPIWLLEGLACFVAKNDIVMNARAMKEAVRHLQVRSLLPYRYRAALFPDYRTVKIYYSLWCHFLRWLTRTKPSGLAHLLQRRRQLSSKALFDREFRRTYGDGADELLRKYLGKRPALTDT